MSQPTFTLWPWKILSMLVPAMALVAAGLAEKYNAPREDSFAIFFSVIAAGNAYLFAMAIGDFGRSVIAIPVGAVAGWVAVVIFSHAAPTFLFLSFLTIVMFVSVLNRSSPVGHGCLNLVLLFFLGFAAAGASRTDPGLSALAGYPFVCAAIAGCMPLQRDFGGCLIAALAGARAALHGMVVGGTVFILGLIIASWVSRGMTWGQIIVVLGVGLLSTMTANYFCVKFIFTAVHRVVAPAPQAPGTPFDEDDSDALKTEKMNDSTAPDGSLPNGSMEAPKDSG
jgi:hypothetical protein